MPSLAAVTPALSAAGPDALAGEVAALFRAELGWDLFTILQCDPARREVVRLYSSNSRDHPVGGRKPYNPVVMQPAFVGGRALHLCRTPEEVARSYANDPKAQIYTAAMNIPVVWDGRLLGLLNLLKRDGAFPEREPSPLLALARLSVPLFLNPHGPPTVS